MSTAVGTGTHTLPGTATASPEALGEESPSRQHNPHHGGLGDGAKAVDEDVARHVDGWTWKTAWSLLLLPAAETRALRGHTRGHRLRHTPRG